MGNLVKTVELRILASAGDAQAQLDDITAKADKLDGDAIKMRFRLDDAEGKAQLDAIKARADKLGFKDVSIKVRVDGAGKAIAELMAVKKEADSAGGPNKFQSLLGKLFDAGGGGPPLSGGESAGGGIPILGSLFGPAGLAIVPVIGAALVEITGLVSGISAAGAGAVAFGALAYPAVKKVETAYSGLNAAQQAYQTAQAKEKIDPTKANQAAVRTASDNLKVAAEAIRKLPPDERKAVDGLAGLVSEFGKLSKAFQPQAFKIFADGLSILNHLLPAVTPFANTFANSLDGLLKKADKFTQSKGFGDFLKQFQSVEGPAVTAIGDGIGKVAGAFGKLITTMSGKDVAQTIGIAFNAIAGIIGGVASVVAKLMSNWDSMSSAARRNAHEVASAFDDMRHGVASAVDGVISTAASLPGKIKAAYAGAGGWLLAAGKAIMGGLLHGIMAGWDAVASFVGGIASKIASLKGPLPKDRVLLTPAGQAIMAGLLAGLQGGQAAINAAAAAIGNTVAGPNSVISGAIAKLKAYIPGDTGLNKWLTSQSARLQALAAKRAALETEIKDADQVAAAEITSNSIMNAAGTAQAAQAGPATPVATSDVIAGMQQQAATVKAFAQQIAQLRKSGLNATSLSQIIGAGSATGGPVAQALLSGGKGAITQVNQLQSQIKTAAGKLGDVAGPAMYQAGVQAAQGLASGLRSQLKALDGVMAQLADDLVAEVKKRLKIKSPSLVFAEIGTMIPAGLAMGIAAGQGAAVLASSRLASATVGPWGGRGGSGTGGGDVHLHFEAMVHTQDSVRQAVQAFREYKRHGGGTALGIA